MVDAPRDALDQRGNVPFRERQERGAIHGRDGALRARIEFANRFDGVTKQLDSDGARRFRGKDVDDAAAHRELSWQFDHFGARVAHAREMRDEFFERDLRVFRECSSERQIERGVLKAPESGLDRRDD